jgi:hypothetical protein
MRASDSSVAASLVKTLTSHRRLSLVVLHATVTSLHRPQSVQQIAKLVLLGCPDMQLQIDPGNLVGNRYGFLDTPRHADKDKAQI